MASKLKKKKRKRVSRETTCRMVAKWSGYKFCWKLCAVLSAVGMTFTTMNVLRAVREVKSTNDLRRRGLGYRLGVPESKRREIESQFSSVPQQRKALINYFIDHDPVASWRAVIVALDWMREKRVADELRHLAEPVTGRAGS